jgi:hypothetical protein
MREPWLCEAWSGAIGVAWGLVYFSSGADIFGTSSLHLLDEISHTISWASFCLVMGVLQIVFLLIDRNCLRWIAAFFMSWFPCMVVLSLALTKPVSPTIAVYGGWAGINLFLIFRLIRRAR